MNYLTFKYRYFTKRYTEIDLWGESGVFHPVIRKYQRQLEESLKFDIYWNICLNYKISNNKIMHIIGIMVYVFPINPLQMLILKSTKK
jgi:hypothetical protein